MKSIVKQSKKNSNKINLWFGLLFFFIIILIAIKPAKYSLVALKGIEVWAKILLPSLLPFFILTKLFASTGVIESVTKFFSPITKKMFNCPSESSYIFLMSILTGYPVGSKLVSDMFNSGNLTKNQAIRTTAFCSNSGPMFILGSVAIGMFADRTLGVIILISHILGAILNGLIYRNYGKKTDENLLPQNSVLCPSTISINLAESVMSSINSILLIGGVICFTFVILELVTTSFLFTNFVNMLSKIGLDKNLVSAIFCGLFEITKGCLMLSNIPLSTSFVRCILTFVISFGGISTFFQARAFLKDIVPAKTFLLQKITHAICSCLVCAIISIFI